MALLHMLHQWSRRQSAVEIYAATVDHGLRPEAAQEARLAGTFARSLGIAHKTLRWKHDGATAARIQERARAARYELLAGHARRIGAGIVMTAHHADDQAETILFRLIRGSGIDGLAGMAAERPLDPLVLARPLLALRKADLVAWCQRHAIAFAEDPGNADSRFARPRLRRLLPDLEKEGLTPEVWARLGRRAARAEAALSHMAEAVEARCTLQSNPDYALVDFAALAREPEEMVLRVLARMVARFNPEKPLRLDRAENLAARLLTARSERKRLTATLGAACIRLLPDGKLSLAREAGRKRGRKTTLAMPLKPLQG